MDPYAVLGISEGFTFKELSETYRAVAGRATPSGRDASEAGLQRVACAFEVLSRDGVSGKVTSATVAAKTPATYRSPLKAPLARLKRALQGLEKPVRQRKLQELSSQLKMELLKYMELSSISQSEPSSSKAPLRAAGCGLQRNRQGLFRAKMNLEHISLYSSYTAASMAVEHHIFLVRLRQLVTGNLKRGLDIGEAFQEAFGMLEEFELRTSLEVVPSPSARFSSFLRQQGIRAYLNIHVARWLGSTHVTSPVLPFTQILDLRKRLLLAREQGWDAFRAEWLSMIQDVGLSRVRKRTGYPAGIGDSAQRKAKTTRKPSTAWNHRCVAHGPELKLRRAVKAAEAALAKVARLKRNKGVQKRKSSALYLK